MVIYKDVSAHSPFRIQKLLAELRQIEPTIQSVEAEYVHLVDTKHKLSATDNKQLQALLTYDTAFNGGRKGALFIVTPRPGTISPWSSKATDIALNCGIAAVNRIERGIAYYISSSKKLDPDQIGAVLCDRMTETVLTSFDEAERLFAKAEPRPLQEVDILSAGEATLQKLNTTLGMALVADEIDYLISAYKELGRNPTDAELMMFGLVNSEHCRHKIFNADWVANGKKQPKSLFKMIKNTYEKTSNDVLSAYTDNSAVLRGPTASWFFSDPLSGVYKTSTEPAHLVIKVETHNHPVAVEPFAGSATGVGGEIRDEGATGRGARTKIGLTGFTVSNLRIPGYMQPWEKAEQRPDRIVSPLNIMLDAPLGGAAFGNEFGRPNLAGYFRTYEETAVERSWGYHKPLVIAGGVGNIRDKHVEKKRLPVGAKLIVLGGPAMLIGLGGGSGASLNSGESSADLDYASVQRANGEMQRRAQEVINSCWALGDNNPIISIHDVGAGGWCNSLPELAHDSARGTHIELRDLPNADPGMSPMEIWCNESQERYVVGIAAENLADFEALCKRERCPFAVAGETTKEERLVVTDRHFGNNPVDLPLSVLFGKPPKMTRKFTKQTKLQTKFSAKNIDLDEAIKRVLHLPAVGSKKFLITIGDRTVGGLSVRDQMVGPWQVPVSDVAVSSSSFEGVTGEAMAMGERSPIAIVNAPASARMAIGEALTNIAAAPIEKLSDIKLSANWMAAGGQPGEDQNLFETVKTVGEDFCPALGLTIPVGKDSLSMRTVWQDKGEDKSVISPLSLIISGFASVVDVNRTLTPELHTNDPSMLIFIDLSGSWQRMAGSALAQVYNQIGDETPDADPELLKSFFRVIQDLNQQQKILAYHDRSDGGLFTTVCEMAFASRSGLELDLSDLPGEPLSQLFNEELGSVIQVSSTNQAAVVKQLQDALGYQAVHTIGKPLNSQRVIIKSKGKVLYGNSRSQLESWWSETSYQIQKLRDNPICAEQEYTLITDNKDPGLSAHVTFELTTKKYSSQPKVAILREEGVNGHVEMAAAFDRAGFMSVDVHLNDVLSGRTTLTDFKGLAACGGFSYGDVLGAGEGWAKSILFHKQLRAQFQEFFARPDTFSLGVCNGCQMLAALKELIPGADNWPRFLRNTSEQFEARVVRLKISDTPSILFKDMAGSLLPIPVAHGEGRAEFESQPVNKKLISAKYVDNYGKVTLDYPTNPNGSLDGIAALTTTDGRATIIMPHPERAFLSKQLSWHPNWPEESPWFKLFQNAREWVDKNDSK